METAIVIVQVLIACAMIDVWLLRYDRPLRARGGDAKTMVEEFRVYGLPDGFRRLVRVLKLGCGALLLVGIWIPAVAVAAGALLAVLMAGAIAMHVKVGDPWLKAVPATFFFALCCFVVYANWTVSIA